MPTFAIRAPSGGSFRFGGGLYLRATQVNLCATQVFFLACARCLFRMEETFKYLKTYNIKILKTLSMSMSIV